MLGLVLCGGKSTRMGSDKGLMASEDGNWATLAFKKLSTLNIPVKLAVNTSQTAAYLQFFNAEQLIYDCSSIAVGGPLLALLSAHDLYPETDLFVLACDLPLMETSLLEQLYEAAKTTQQHEAFVFVHEGNMEPLCAIYKAEGLARIKHELAAGNLIRYSMKSVLSRLAVNMLDIPAGKDIAFTNFNTQGNT